MKKTVWFCQTVRVKGKTFSKEKSKTWEKEFFKKMEWYSERARTFFFFQKRFYKKRKKERSGDETTLIGVCAQIEVHATQFSTTRAIWLFTKLSEGLHFFLNGVKKRLHHDRDIDHTIVALHFADHLPQFLNTQNSENLSWHHTRQCTESAAPRQFSAHLLSSTMCTMTYSTHQIVVSSRPLFSFGFILCTFLHPCSSVNPKYVWAYHGGLSSAFGRWREPRWLYLPICLFFLPFHWVVFPKNFVF